jgi:hypothetical protein
MVYEYIYGCIHLLLNIAYLKEQRVQEDEGGMKRLTEKGKKKIKSQKAVRARLGEMKGLRKSEKRTKVVRACNAVLHPYSPKHTQSTGGMLLPSFSPLFNHPHLFQPVTVLNWSRFLIGMLPYRSLSCLLLYH